MFIATNVPKVQLSRNNPRFLTRFEFLESLIRVAVAKYSKATAAVCLPPPAACSLLLEKHLLPYADRMDMIQWKFSRLYTERVDNVFKPFVPVLRAVYKRFSGRFALPAETPTMSTEVCCCFPRVSCENHPAVRVSMCILSLSLCVCCHVYSVCVCVFVSLSLRV